MNDPVPVILALVLAAIGGVVLLFGFRRLHEYRLIADTPTSKIRSMAMGFVEVQGSAFAKEYLRAPFSDSECVYYRYEIEEYREHRHKDSDGKVRVERRWETVATGERRAPFFAKDDTGDVYVDPNDAEFSVTLRKVFYQRRGIFGAIGVIIDALADWDRGGSRPDRGAWKLEPMDVHSHHTFMTSVGDRKYFEYFIDAKDPLFVMGTAANSRGAPGGVLIRKGDNEPTFIIANQKEEAVMGSLKWQALGLLILGGALAVAGISIVIYVATQG